MNNVKRSAGEAWSALVLATVTAFSGTTSTDKNGEKPVMLQVLAGEFPVNRIVLAGTVANRMGLEVGKTYALRCLYRGTDEVYGDDYNWTLVKEANTISEIAAAQRDIGPAQPFNAWRPEGVKDVYKRTSDAVESAQSQRIRDGRYKPAFGSERSHENAKEVIKGSSNDPANKQSLTLSKEDLEKALAKRGDKKEAFKAGE